MSRPDFKALTNVQLAEQLDDWMRARERVAARFNHGRPLSPGQLEWNEFLALVADRLRESEAVNPAVAWMLNRKP